MHGSEFETRIKLNHNIHIYFRKCIQCIRKPNDHTCSYLFVLQCRGDLDNKSLCDLKCCFLCNTRS